MKQNHKTETFLKRNIVFLFLILNWSNEKKTLIIKNQTQEDCETSSIWVWDFWQSPQLLKAQVLLCMHQHLPSSFPIPLPFPNPAVCGNLETSGMVPCNSVACYSQKSWNLGMLLKSAAGWNSDQLLLEFATQWSNCGWASQISRLIETNPKLGFCTIPKSELYLFLQWCIAPHRWLTFSFQSQSKQHDLTRNKLKYLFLKDILKLLMPDPYKNINNLAHYLCLPYFVKVANR